MKITITYKGTSFSIDVPDEKMEPIIKKILQLVKIKKEVKHEESRNPHNKKENQS